MGMWKSLFAGSLLAATAWSQNSPQVELANLREDVRGLTQKMGEMSLRLEQLERENSELRQRLSGVSRTHATVAQLNDAATELRASITSAATSARNEALQQVAVQMEKLVKQTNAALDSIAKAQATRPVVNASFDENFPKEGISYTVQKGDTLAVISKKTGAKQQDIVNANKLADPSRITVGQTLFIPGGK